MLRPCCRAPYAPRNRGTASTPGKPSFPKVRRNRKLTMSTINLSHFLLGAHGLAFLGRWTKGIASGDRSPVRGAKLRRTSCAVAQLGRKILRPDADTAKRLMFTIVRVSIEKPHREDKPRCTVTAQSSIVAGRKTRFNCPSFDPESRVSICRCSLEKERPRT